MAVRAYQLALRDLSNYLASVAADGGGNVKLLVPEVVEIHCFGGEAPLAIGTRSSLLFLEEGLEVGLPFFSCQFSNLQSPLLGLQGGITGDSETDH